MIELVVIEFTVKEQKLSEVETGFNVNYSKNYLQFAFSFNKTWEDYTKYCVFHYKNKHYEDQLEYDDNLDKWIVTVPDVVLKGKGFRFNLYGVYKDNEEVEHIITTQKLHLKLFESGLDCEVSEIKGGASDHLIQTIFEKLDTKYDSVALSGYSLIFSNDDGTVLGTISFQDLFDAKSNVGHKHTVSDVSDLDEHYTPVGHKHTVSDVTDIATVYENKQVNKKNDISGDYSSDNASYPTVKAVKERYESGTVKNQHVHGNISSDGKIGSSADKIVVTGVNGALETVESVNADHIIDDTAYTNLETPANSNQSIINAAIDSELGSIDDVYEKKSNKVTSLSRLSTDTEYPSAKCVFEAIHSEITGSTDLIMIYDASVDTYFRSYKDTVFDFTGQLTVDWGDGNVETYTSGRLLHYYDSQDIYTIRISGNINTLKEYCFKTLWGLKKVSIPTTVTTLEKQAFYQCENLVSIDIPNSVTSIGENCFMNCKGLVDITVPNSITSISDDCFYGCSSLTSLDIPKSITSIGGRFIYECTGLDVLIFEPIVPPTLTGGYHFHNVPATCKIFVPKGYLSDYTSASGYPSSSTYTYLEYEKNEENIVLPNILDGSKYPVTSNAVHDSLAGKADTNHTHSQYLTDSDIVDSVSDNDSHAVTSNAVADKFTDLMGRLTRIGVIKTTSLSIQTPLHLVYGDDFNITGTLMNTFDNTPIEGATVKLFIGNTQVATATTNSSGAVSFTHCPVHMGTHTFQLSFDGSDLYHSCSSSTVTKEVEKETTVLTVTTPSNNSAFDMGDSITLEGSLLTDDGDAMAGESVVISEGGTVIETLTTDSDGEFSTTLSFMGSGYHTLSIAYAGDDYYTQSTATLTILINSYEFTLSDSSLIVEVGDTINLSATLLKNGNPFSGETITLVCSDGSEYTSNTNSQGIATFNISDLSTTGEFTFTASYGSLEAECTVINGVFYLPILSDQISDLDGFYFTGSSGYSFAFSEEWHSIGNYSLKAVLDVSKWVALRKDGTDQHEAIDDVRHIRFTIHTTGRINGQFVSRKSDNTEVTTTLQITEDGTYTIDAPTTDDIKKIDLRVGSASSSQINVYVDNIVFY